MSQTRNNSQIWTISRAARELGVCDMTVRRFVTRDLLQALRTESGIRVFVADDVRRLAVELQQRLGDAR